MCRAPMRRKRSGLRVGAAVVLLLSLACPLCRSATPQDVDAAIERAKEYLYSQQKDGNWERSPSRNPTTAPSELTGGQWGGITALCTYALLAGGERPEDPRIKQAVEFLLKADMVGTYALGMRANVWNLLPKSAEVKQAIYKDLQHLRRGVKTGGPNKGFYDYICEGSQKSQRFDHSVSQYGVLGVWACAENIEGIPPEFWNTVSWAWRRSQHDSGGWSYERAAKDVLPDTIPMTAAGVATLFIAEDFINRGKSLEAAGNAKDPNIDKGIKWISEHYRSLYEKPGVYAPWYGLYGIERIGVASGYKYLGNVNWYEDGADYLLKTQNKKLGGWLDPVGTSFAILFLSRGRAPVVMNKLEYELTSGAKTTAANWNQRPRDAANLAKFIGKQAERALNWQIVNLKAPVEEMHDAPILYISGNQALAFNDEQAQKLKQFVEDGGLILAQADTAAAAFANSFKKLGADLFQYEFRPLPAGHAIYTEEQFPAAKWRRKPNVLAMSNGVRELMILLPDGDPARYWQGYDLGGHSEIFELAADIFQYSVDKQNLRNKGETYLIAPDPKIKPGRTIKLARVKYDGNWDPEPGGWRREAAVMHNAANAELHCEAVEVKNLAASDAKIAQMCGTGPVKLDQDSRNAVKNFVEGGGVLIVDAAGGSAEFAQSIEQEFDAIFGAEAKSLKEPLPADHPIYRLKGNLEVAYRSFAQRVLGRNLKVARLRLMEHNGKPAVIYSPEDISAGLVGQSVDGIVGYAPATAAKLMVNILLYAAGDKPNAD